MFILKMSYIFLKNFLWLLDTSRLGSQQSPIVIWHVKKRIHRVSKIRTILSEIRIHPSFKFREDS